jgi:translation initiation factor 2B subunit (eIF-2B alpha/beta/delta family)
MPDLLAIGQGLSALKGALDILQTWMGLRDAAKIQETTVELNSKILAAQSALATAQETQTSLVDTLRSLEKEVARLKAWQGGKEDYELKDLGGGSTAYVLKEEKRETEPLHYL